MCAFFSFLIESKCEISFNYILCFCLILISLWASLSGVVPLKFTNSKSAFVIYYFSQYTKVNKAPCNNSGAINLE